MATRSGADHASGMGLIDVYAAVIPDFPYHAEVHVHYQETKLRIKDGFLEVATIPCKAMVATTLSTAALATIPSVVVMATVVPRRRTAIDAAPFRQQVKHILRESVRSLEEGYEDDPFSDQLLEVIEKALAFARNEDGESAIALLTAVTEACVDEWINIGDYGGDSFAITEFLNEAWTEVILSTELMPPENVDLRVILEEWQDAMDTDFSMRFQGLPSNDLQPRNLLNLHRSQHNQP